MLTKLDLKKTLKHLYSPSPKAFVVVEVPTMNFLMIDGAGDPNTTPAYQEAIEALYAVSYTLKFAVKKELSIDYPVMPLEGLWWVEDMRQFSAENKEDWHWTAMIMQPEPVTGELVTAAIDEAGRKKPLPALSRMRFQSYQEGLSVQIMHIGPFKDEGPTLARLHGAFIPAHGYEEAGKHHEIYLSDIRRAAPAKWKTVLRQPVRIKAAQSR